MKTKNETAELDQMIFDLEKKRAAQFHSLKEQFHVTVESLKPGNLIKSAFHDLTSGPDLKNNLVSNVIGLGTGLLTKKLFIGGSHNPIKRLLGTAVQFAVANVVSRNSDNIKSTGGGLLQRLFKSRKSEKSEFQKIERV